ARQLIADGTAEKYKPSEIDCLRKFVDGMTDREGGCDKMEEATNVLIYGKTFAEDLEKIFDDEFSAGLLKLIKKGVRE
ncbi:MAG TPA: hypothetical protein VMW24_24265, partial [Sedimentisphaerales bacterium]|nr:hypothetical protein [Sedimentisphaerales bacterium]